LLTQKEKTKLDINKKNSHITKFRWWLHIKNQFGHFISLFT